MLSDKKQLNIGNFDRKALSATSTGKPYRSSTLYTILGRIQCCKGITNRGRRFYEPNVTYKSFLGLKSFVEESINILTENKSPKGNIERYAMSFVAYEFSIMIWQYNHVGKENKERALQFLKDYNWTLRYGQTKKRA